MSELPTLLVTYRFTDSLVERIRGVAEEHFQLVYEPIGAKRSGELLGRVEVIFGDPSREEILPATRLRWVQVFTAGVNRLDLPLLKEKGALLTSSRGMHGPQMTELVFSLLLEWSRQLHVYRTQQQRHVWDKRPFRNTRVLRGMTMGIFGYGTIGRSIGVTARAFGMNVIGVRRTVSGGLTEDGVELVTLEEALTRSDVIVNVLPETPGTVRLFNRDRFRMMKRRPFFINVGRGGTVDEASLIEAVKEGTISGAALDVFSVEPLPADHPLWNTENVFITPHVGGLVLEYWDIAVDMFLENLRRYMDGQPLTNIVDFERGY
jgi:phosphoglycerate dehydrogenase-like enzyme